MSRDARIVRVFSTLSVAVSLALSLALCRANPSMVTATLVFGLLAMTAWHGVARLRQGRAVNVILAAALLNLLIVVPELALRLRDFRYEAGIQFGYPRPSRFAQLQPDPQLFWRRSREDRTVNSLGFVGREVPRPKPKGWFRIIFLGDSVTEQGFPEVVGHMLNLARSSDSLRYECVSLATAGYSSYQGRVLAELYGTTLEPDAAVVLFGWNDHYRAYGAPDAQKSMPRGTPTSGRLSQIRQESRLVQLAAWVKDTLRGTRPRPLDELRVSPKDYRENLTHIHELFRKVGIPVVFLTAPTSHYRLDAPDYLVEREFATDKASSMELHRGYNGIVREVADSTGAIMLDLESELGSLPPRDLGALFSRDGIHLSLAGVAIVSARITETLQQRVAPPAVHTR
ncbi:MAG: GDSL-type esterase/lipase family protein [Candidatus Eisenbacteria bacterium]|jgi:lysophospholipase L1-like esterase|nr:GDSL-type esterase/lipase family protein [Candidatus Eisenbacteria bacterium]